MTPHTTRLAPSPTGALHLGNARTFLINWALARQRGWQVLLRIEDLDTPRVKPETIAQTRDTLAWLGIDWDREVPLQSTDTVPSRNAMHALAAAGLVYPSDLTRSQLAEARSAPNEGDSESRFPAALRPEHRPAAFDRPEANWRFACPERSVDVADGFAGPVRVVPSDDVGDFVVWTKRGAPAYQLAVVIDDHRQGVTRVVRGDDLLPSTGRQMLLMEPLAIEPPGYIHVPLVRGSDGRRLAKRHGDTRLDAYRRRGVPAGRIVALIAGWCGMGRPKRMTAAEFAAAFRLGTMPKGDVTFSPEDDRWLLDGARSL
ncbi:MAG: glutamate--tRNA ligase family protein [Planctomycetota bacterium]